LENNTLFIIPARGGSKGIPRKNIKFLAGKPLIQYTIEVARQIVDQEHICVSTDDVEIKKVVEELGQPVPFLRPAELASDKAGTQEVLLHALEYYENFGINYDRLVLLQPTSPFRQSWQIQQALDAWEVGLEMIVSVKVTKSNPYYVLFEENVKGYLEKSKKGNFITRQDCPVVYEYNGAIYVIDVKSLKKKPISLFTQIKKYVMDENTSLDIDTYMDWKIAEYLLNEKLV
jgi:N-acylneuraminate cytidylyltransferase